MTKIYFVRHAQPDFSVLDDLTRPLNEKGVDDTKKVTDFLLDKSITKVYSSPFKRAVDTIKDFADKLSLVIHIIEDFRERKIDDGWIEDFNSFAKNQWDDFEYRLPQGECLKEVQERNINALHKVIKENMDENIVIGTHGTALSTILNYYDKKFDYNDFKRIKNLMPFIVCIEFDGMNFVSAKEFIL